MPARTPKSSAATFDLVSCRRMLSKLEREIGRASAESRREHLADHCTNAAWTAWHLVDHVWKDVKYDLKVEAAVAREAGTPLRNFDKGAFHDFVLSENQCPELKYCRLITNASKHTGADLCEGDPVFEIDASMSDTGLVSSGGLDWMTITEVAGERRWAYKIGEDDSLDGALHLLQKVRDYWADLIDRHGIGSG